MDLSGSSSPSSSSFVTESGNVISLQQSIDTTLQFHMNRAKTVVPDERDFIRPWRHRLREILSNENETFLAFLEKPEAEWEGVLIRTEFLKSLETPNFASNSKWMETHVVPMVDLSGVRCRLEEELGGSLDSLRDSLHRVLDFYQKSIHSLFELNSQLTRKVQALNNLKDRLGSLSKLGIESPDTPELSVLQTSILDYIRSCYDRYEIEETYESFCNEYTRFIALRSLVQTLEAGETRRGTPLCTICTVEPISSALIPCGHTFCTSCSQKQWTVCYLCRCTVRERQRLYFT